MSTSTTETSGSAHAPAEHKAAEYLAAHTASLQADRGKIRSAVRPAKAGTRDS
jgi:hypothetical protein